ncbi:hypothetical protein C8J56DRAFT_881884 [Mycena floridula]|nr:hypothetical protein C8J56DRAFT_881884 [Mycena floridula]
MSLLATLTGFTHAKTDWSLITPDSDYNAAMVIYTILAILVTIVQFLHCCAAVNGTMEQFSNIMIAASTMVLLYCAEREWYENVIILCVRKGFGAILILAWIILIVAQTILYHQPADEAYNSLLTIALYQDHLTHAIIGFYNLVTLDIAISSFVLLIRVNKLRAAETEMDQWKRVRALFLIAPLLAIRSLGLLMVHIISLVSVPDHLVNTIWNLIFFGWLILDPTLCYIALDILLHSSQVPPPIRFRDIVVASWRLFISLCYLICGPRKVYIVEHY